MVSCCAEFSRLHKRSDGVPGPVCTSSSRQFWPEVCSIPSFLMLAFAVTLDCFGVYSSGSLHRSHITLCLNAPSGKQMASSKSIQSRHGVA